MMAMGDKNGLYKMVDATGKEVGSAADISPIEPITMDLRPSKKKRIALLEKQVADLQARILRLEGWPVAFPGAHTCTPPYTPTTDGTGDYPADLTPRHAMESTDGVRVPGVNVTKNETAPDGSTIFEAEISAASLRSVNVTC